MLAVLQIVALTVFFFISQEVLRRAGKWITWCLFLLVPLALTPWWLNRDEFDLFQWVKLYTVCFCVSWFTLLRFTSLGQRPWARNTIPLLLAANILEATILDFLGHGLAHTLNAMAGVLLIALVPFGSKSVAIDTPGRCRDLQFGLSRGWILGYTLWNLTFVYLNYPVIAGHHVAVLASAMIAGAIDPRRWIQTRAYTLGLSLLVTATFTQSVVSWFDTSSWFNERVALVAAGTALVVVVAIAIRARRFDGQALRARGLQPS